MPYAHPDSANNRLADAIQDAKARNNNSSEWREVLTATTKHRSVLIHWMPGRSDAMHTHPNAEEIFVIHEGQAEFDFDDGRTRVANPGSILYAAAGQPHAISVLGKAPLLMRCFMSANHPTDTGER